MPVLERRRRAHAAAACILSVLAAAPLAGSSASAHATGPRAAVPRLVLGSVLDPTFEEWHATNGHISGNGRVIAFDVKAPELPLGTPAPVDQTYVRNLRTDGPARLASPGLGGDTADADTQAASVSGDGRFVVFWSAATNLVAGDSNGLADVFVRDVASGVTERVSVGSAGEQGTGESTGGFISADGRRVAFTSQADNLVPGDTNGRNDVFVRDLVAGTTQRVSLAVDGGQSVWPARALAMSADGQHVTFLAAGADLSDPDAVHRYLVYAHHLVSGRTELVTLDRRGGLPDGRSIGGSLSGNGRYVAFQSPAGDLVKGDEGRDYDVFVRDLKRDRNERVSVRPDGSETEKSYSLLTWDGAISDDGRFVAFTSNARLAAGQRSGAFIRDRKTDTTRRVTGDHGVRLAGVARRAVFAARGGLVAEDSDRRDDVYVALFSR